VKANAISSLCAVAFAIMALMILQDLLRLRGSDRRCAPFVGHQLLDSTRYPDGSLTCRYVTAR
jgi:hypothetical protein